MSDKNPDLVALHQSLGDVVDALVAKQEASTDPAAIKALADQIRETLFRVTGVQRALFAQQTAAIQAAVADVQAAQADVEKAIGEIENLNRFLGTISQFLTLVDRVVKLAT